MKRTAASVLTALLLAACSADAPPDYVPDASSTDADTDTDTDADSDGDSDTDADADTDGDTDTDTDGDTDTDTDTDGDTDTTTETTTETDTDTDTEVPVACTPETAEELCGSAELCVDGYCCDTVCDGECEACDLSGLEGLCSFVDPGEDPEEECAEEDAATCGTTGWCDGYGACELYGGATACGTAACPGPTCDGGSYLEYPAECVTLCDGEGTCAGCACEPEAETVCAPGAGNECCVPGCDPVSGCLTTAGACTDVCTATELTLGRPCDGCGANLATGTCGAGTTYPCDADAACEVLACGGVVYTCTNAGGTWEWREGAACDDGDLCTYGDACDGGACAGTAVDCSSTACATRACNGTATCTETPQPSTVECGTTACPANQCDDLDFLEYPATCTNHCDGFGACGACACEAAATSCTDGGGCCEASCSDVLGCLTVPGACGSGGDTCGPTLLEIEQSCEGCGAPGAVGACVPGGSFACDETTHAECEAISCGGVLYYCLEDPVDGWGWTAEPWCDDGNACTYDDLCSGGSCQGKPITCASTDCMDRTCNGTSACTETPKPSTTACGTTACGADTCDGVDYYDYPGTCTRYCSGTADACEPCTCTAAVTTCGVGAGNQCCVAGCDMGAGGCLTTAEDCAETCTTSQLTVGQTCVGCGLAGATGLCSGGAVHTCTAAIHTPCQIVTCGGVTYRCTNAGGTWEWRTGVACDDGDQCTFNDACIGSVCGGTSITCTSTDCMEITCNGTSECTETPKPSTTACGSTVCNADYCSSLSFYDYPASCTRYCSGTADICDPCACVATTTTCGVGAGNECCEATCSGALGCRTVPGACGSGGDTCGATLLEVAQTCEGCGAGGASGTCIPGGSYACDEITHFECETRSCGGSLYYCLEDPVDGWGWTTIPACDDGDPCTYGDACSGGECVGSVVDCTSTACMTRACNGTAACTETTEPSTTVCGTTACDADHCSGLDFYDYPADCTRFCSGTDDTCSPCACTAVQTTCDVGPGNQCCEEACDAATGGCLTTADACPETCSASQLIVGQTCLGCGTAGAEGICSGGAVHACTAANHNLCQVVTCGGTQYHCTNTGGDWQWRTGVACNDGDPCTYNDACGGGTCGGTTVTCTSTDCMSVTCNGTSTCTETPKPSNTECGATACGADWCDVMNFHDYPVQCTRTCSGTADVCEECSCTAETTTCATGPGNQCCTAACDAVAGCTTADDGSCADDCGATTVTTGRTCVGCGGNLAEGTCGGGTTVGCGPATACQTATCGGSAYICTNAGGTWEWRADPACDDGDPCTYGDTCGAGGCGGTAITCTDTACLTRTCNGTATCTETPKPSTTECGATTCPPDACSSGSYHAYPETCAHTCSGTDDTCNGCSCTASVTVCATGSGNQCCVADCDDLLGCTTEDGGGCADVCGATTMTFGRTCTGCGDNLAEGTCTAGTTATCEATTACQTATCGGTGYTCTNAGGTWEWRTDPACDDGDLCTTGDACGGGTCQGTPMDCGVGRYCLDGTCYDCDTDDHCGADCADCTQDGRICNLAGTACTDVFCESRADTAETCETAATIGRDDLDGSFPGDNNSFAGNVNINCDGYTQAGRDVVYRIYLFAGETVVLDLEVNDNDLSLGLLWPGAAAEVPCSSMTLLDCSDSDGTADEAITHVAAETGWYYVLVDSYYSNSSGYGPYTLDIRIVDAVPGECWGGNPSACTSNQSVMFDWNPGTIIWPMTRATSGSISGMEYIYTSIANQGTATTTFTLPCDDVWYLWGLKWIPSDSLANFYFTVDTQAEVNWNLAGAPYQSWAWDQANGSMTPVWSSPLVAGNHTIRIRGGASSGSDSWEHPALGYVVFTNDPAYVPPDPGSL